MARPLRSTPRERSRPALTSAITGGVHAGNLTDGVDAALEINKIMTWLMDAAACPTDWSVHPHPQRERVLRPREPAADGRLSARRLARRAAQSDAGRRVVGRVRWPASLAARRWAVGEGLVVRWLVGGFSGWWWLHGRMAWRLPAAPHSGPVWAGRRRSWTAPRQLGRIRTRLTPHLGSAALAPIGFRMSCEHVSACCVRLLSGAHRSARVLPRP